MKTKQFILSQIMKPALFIASLFLVLAGTAQTGDSFADWDTDRDSKISKTEFSERYANDYADTWRSNQYDYGVNDNVKQGDNESGIFDDDDNDVLGSEQEGVFEDQEDDGLFDDNEFFESSYNMWDKNDDQLLDENEWRYGYDNSYGEFTDDDFNSFDTNRDSQLDYNEYRNSFSDNGYYSSWDLNRDGSLDNNEYSEGVFDTWDENKDGFIDENEYNTFGDQYLNMGID